MKKILVSFLIILAFGFSVHAAQIGPFDKATAAADGRLIIETAKDFNKPDQDLLVYAHMTLKSGEAISDTRKVIIKEKMFEDLTRALFRFTDSMKRGLTFLTIETHGSSNDQYLFTPAIGRPRQIASQDRQNNFEDTDLTNEDLGGIKLDEYTYKRGNDTLINDRPCFKVTSVATDADARFPRRTSWIDQETFIPVQIKVYNRDNKLARVLAAGDIRAVKNIHLPFKTVSKNLVENHTTLLEVVRAEVDSNLDPIGFDKEKMGEPWKENF
ncbi:MAG: outer membrane lipoprotein-sorting protein [Proteobacteria bacterium]|nr:outer membrane lipoprotein-sorting protein [Pseudomonadota bacterium]